MNSQDLSDMLSKPPGCPTQLSAHFVKEQRAFTCFESDLLSPLEDMSPQGCKIRAIKDLCRGLYQ